MTVVRDRIIASRSVVLQPDQARLFFGYVEEDGFCVVRTRSFRAITEFFAQQTVGRLIKLLAIRRTVVS